MATYAKDVRVSGRARQLRSGWRSTYIAIDDIGVVEVTLVRPPTAYAIGAAASDFDLAPAALLIDF